MSLFFNAGRDKDQHEKSFVTTNDNISSQLFSKAWAFSVGKPNEYDWKKHPFTENIYKTIDVYKI